MRASAHAFVERAIYMPKPKLNTHTHRDDEIEIARERNFCFLCVLAKYKQFDEKWFVFDVERLIEMLCLISTKKR